MHPHGTPVQLAYGHLIKELWEYAHDWAVHDTPMIRAGYTPEQLPVGMPLFYPLRSDNQRVAEMLLQIGLLEEVETLPLFSFTCEKADVVNLVVERHEIGPPFDDVLKLCGWMFREYGTKLRGLSFKEGQGFSPGDPMKNTIAALEKVGLVRMERGRYFWQGRMLEINRDMDQSYGPALV